MRIFRFEEVVQVWEGLYFYGFGEDDERGEGYFSSIEEALEHARKNTDEDDTVNIGRGGDTRISRRWSICTRSD